MKQLRILAPTRYPWTFNGPRHSAHLIERRAFVPFNYFSSRLEGVTILNPFPLRQFDLIHAFNRIPISRTPFVIGFESHLPRAFGLEQSAYFSRLVGTLAGPRCRAIVAISEYAARTFRAMHADLPGDTLNALHAKLRVQYPSIDIPPCEDEVEEGTDGPYTVTFVGNHFGRKGGCVAVRLAELAMQRNIPLQVEIVSGLEVGSQTWTDPLSRTFFDRYFRLLDLPNVRFHRTLENRAVGALLRQSHFCLLATFSDTFGFSAVEAMANSVPVIATRQGALPEFISHLVSGIVLDLETNELGEWCHVATGDRTSDRYAAIYAAEIDRMAKESLDAICKVLGTPGALKDMRRKARATAEQFFDGRSANSAWDALYEAATGGSAV